MTTITLDARARVNRATTLAMLTQLARHTDPMLEHGGLLSEVLEALARGGMDVWELIDCVLAELEVRP